MLSIFSFLPVLTFYHCRRESNHWYYTDGVTLRVEEADESGSECVLLKFTDRLHRNSNPTLSDFFLALVFFVCFGSTERQ